jgi:hypothetical protein
MLVQEKERELDRLAMDLYEKHEAQFTPTHPWVLVRVMPREQFTGLLWLPDTKQNKPIHEGIVLTTWEPFTKHWREKHNGEWIDCQAEISTDFKAGDHVTYHWSSGMPVPGMSEKMYRLVPEHTRAHRGIDSNGIIFGKLNYPQEAIKEQLFALLHDECAYGTNDKEVVNKILAKFDVVRKTNLYSRTTSGV